MVVVVVVVVELVEPVDLGRPSIGQSMLGYNLAISEVVPPMIGLKCPLPMRLVVVVLEPCKLGIQLDRIVVGRPVAVDIVENAVDILGAAYFVAVVGVTSFDGDELGPARRQHIELVSEHLDLESRVTEVVGVECPG